MPKLTLCIAGFTISISGDEHLSKHLNQLYGDFLCNKPAESKLHWIGSDCLIDGHLRARASHPDAIPALTAILLHRQLIAMRPTLEIFHGNALRAPDESALILTGPSGAGKTTITEFLTGEGWAVAAEDRLILEPGDPPICHRYPRARAVRDQFGEKRYERYPMTLKGNLPLARAKVLLLAPGKTSQSPRPALACSYLDEELLEKIAAVAAVRQTGQHNIPVIDFFEPLSRSQYRSISQLLAAKHSVMISYQSEKISWQFAQRPALVSIKPEEALPMLLAQRLSIQPASPETWMRTAKILSQAEFFRFTPGGAPEQSAASVRSLIL